MGLGPTQPVRLPPRPAPPAPSTSPGTVILIMVVVVAALSFGREIFIPLALSLLLSFMLAPVATRLRRWGLGRVPSVLAVAVLVTLIVTGFGALVTSQVIQLADNLPRYEQNLRAKIRALGEAAPGGGVFERARDFMRDVGQEIEDAAQDADGEADAARDAEQEPIPVEVHEPPPGPVEVLWEVVGPLAAPLATAGLVVVFVIFMLLQREDLRDRMIRLFGTRDVHRTTEALNDAGRRIGRYLLMQLLINVLYGIPVGIGLYLIGVPNPVLWGVLATVLRFVPYIGPVAAATAPIALSVALDAGWAVPLMTLALFLTLELFSNNVLEPWLYGSSTGLSPLAILLAAVFWTTLWGPIGLLLSTPLTVCLAVLGRHIPQLQFFEVLLGDEPVLAPEVKFYQRLLAGDPEEAAELAEEFLGERSLDELYDRVVMPALAAAEQDRLRRVLERERQEAIASDTKEMIEELMADDLAAGKFASAGAAQPEQDVIFCLGARNSLDETAAAMLVHLLLRRWLQARPLPSGAMSFESLGRLQRDGVALVCLSSVNPRALQHARRMVQRLRQHFRGDVRIMLALWQAELGGGAADEALAVTGADELVTSLPQAVRQIEATLQPAAPETAAPPTAA